jgi:uncharacterized protein
LTLVFLIIALVYSAVGFGGGSSYIAALALFDYPYESIPVIALICNVIVVSGGIYHFRNKGHFKWSLFWPYAVSSIPMAFIGGRIPISREIFLLLLGVCLFLIALRLLLFNRGAREYSEYKMPRIPLAFGLGGVLGLIAGMVGIGGGIFLAPLLLHLKWGLPKQIAATAALFILLNSLSGLAGQFVKDASTSGLLEYWPLFLSVFIGGQIGSRIGSGPVLSQRMIKYLTALLVLFVSLRIFYTLI